MPSNSPRKAHYMPNVRHCVLMNVDGYQYEVKSKLKGHRRRWWLEWIPYITGQQASLVVTIKASGQPFPGKLAYFLKSDIKDRKIQDVLNELLEGKTAITIESPYEYVSAPSNYRWALRLRGKTDVEENLADFTAFSRDWVAVTFLIAGFTLFFAGANLVAGLLAIFTRD